MILVILGTQDKPFTRLLDAVEAYAKKHPKETIIVQNGQTPYESSHLQLQPFFTPEDLDQTIAKADLVIAHGGVGTIMGALKHHKKVIATPRLKQYGEHTNDHQLQIIKALETAGYILPLYDLSKLDITIKAATHFKPKVIKSNNAKMCALVSKEINKYIGE